MAPSRTRAPRGFVSVVRDLGRIPGNRGRLTMHALLLVVGIAVGFVVLVLSDTPFGTASRISYHMALATSVLALGVSLALGRRIGAASFLVLLATALVMRSQAVHHSVVDLPGNFWWRLSWINQIAWVLACSSAVIAPRRPSPGASAAFAQPAPLTRGAALLITHGAGFLLLTVLMVVEHVFFIPAFGPLRAQVTVVAPILFGGVFAAVCLSATALRPDRSLRLLPEALYVLAGCWVAYRIANLQLIELSRTLAALGAFALTTALGQRLNLGPAAIRTAALSVGCTSLFYRSLSFSQGTGIVPSVWVLGLAALFAAPRLGTWFRSTAADLQTRGIGESRVGTVIRENAADLKSQVESHVDDARRRWPQPRTADKTGSDKPSASAPTTASERRSPTIPAVGIRYAAARPSWSPRRMRVAEGIAVVIIVIGTWLWLRAPAEETDDFGPGTHQETHQGPDAVNGASQGRLRSAAVHEIRDQAFGSDVLWSHDGTYLYATQPKNQKLVRLRYPNWEPAGEITFPSKPHDIAVCSGHILVARARVISVVDAARFFVRSEIVSPGSETLLVSRDCETILSAGSSRVAFTSLGSVAGESGGRTVRPGSSSYDTDDQGLWFTIKRTALTPDGTYLIALDGDELFRFEVHGFELQYRISSKTKRSWSDLVISDDGRHFGLSSRPSGDALIFQTSNLEQEVLAIETEGRVLGMAFGGAQRPVMLVLETTTRPRAYELGVYSSDGVQRARYPIGADPPDGRLALRPEGNKVAFVAQKRLKVVTLPSPGGG